ncbi:MAG: heavy metal translocating P-type ATPase metal-binding domain-containing protein [Chitinophagaceae bacterium]|nr:heavy metal translocating P-type ATPase metal-binding domain-containing protein [Chitinophagaceae bacterium]
MSVKENADIKLTCYHCGEHCADDRIQHGNKIFCCQGCKMVYQILEQSDLCEYYDLNKNPGINRRFTVREDKFAFLDDEKIIEKLIQFRNDEQTHVMFYLPQMHCSSCLYLLENLHKIHEGVISTQVNFPRKEIEIVFQTGKTTLRKVAETLTGLGYEPYISLNDLNPKRPSVTRKQIYQLGIAGFCFGNIMLLSFPEYLGIDASEETLLRVFRWLSLALSLPVVFYSAMPYYESAFKSIQKKYINIDAPIVLAIALTFIRSVYEVISGTGSGYFDSLTGIVFFLLIGRILQDKTYRSLSFDRDYTSYFPIAVTVLKENKPVAVSLPDIKPGDTLLIHNEELIPADGILSKGKGYIDYSFVTGESQPVFKEVGEMIYAGGKQKGGNIEILVIKEVSQSYLTRLWNREEMKNEKLDFRRSRAEFLNRYFSSIVFGIAALTAAYWGWHDASKIWPAITAIFIVACPCALALAHTFTNGNVLRILSRNRLYLRNAQVLEEISKITHIVFDKTGTLTSTENYDVEYSGKSLSDKQLAMIVSLAGQSAHPLSKAIAGKIKIGKALSVQRFQEIPGKGIQGMVEGVELKMGNAAFVKAPQIRYPGSGVHVCIGTEYKGYFRVRNHYRDRLPAVIQNLKKQFRLSVVSGDNENEKETLQKIFGEDTPLLFHQKPEDKLNYIHALRQKGEHVMMLGDGLNDAGALKASHVGIAVTENSGYFTPASDAILLADRIPLLPRFICMAQWNKKVLFAAFAYSVIYNVIGLTFAVQAALSPMIAAILMPSSSIGIVLITYGVTNLLARRLEL